MVVLVFIDTVFIEEMSFPSHKFYYTFHTPENLCFSTPENHGLKKIVKVCLTLPWAAMMAPKYVN
jgi:hypothetical protein